MNSEQFVNIDLNLAFRRAENIARKRSGKAWLMANLLVPRSRRGYLFLCYAYLRWVDNFVDNTEKSFNEKKDFIENQINLIDSICSYKNPDLNSTEETYLYYFLNFSFQNKKESLVEDLRNMISAMRMDVYRLRCEGIFSEKELSCYISLLNKSMFGITDAFLLADKGSNTDYKNLGKLLWYAGILRDFFEDLECGYINISREDIDKYSINIRNAGEDENLNKWLKDKVPEILNLLENEVSLLKSMPFRVRLFWSFAYPFYLHKILRIKVYNFSYNYLSKKNLIYEIRSYLKAACKGSETVYRMLSG